jgi:hypothetical protein
MAITIIDDERGPTGLSADAHNDGDHLWVPAADLEAATGWSLKAESLCRGELCVPLPADGSWTDGQGRIDAVAFARRDGRLVLGDEARGIWAIGARTETHVDGLAPDFTLPDLDGTLHSLSDYRGRKVFLYTWGSYCGCSFDPPVWEVIYGELRVQNLEMISVALDTAGSDAVHERIRPDALDERPDVIRRLRGWSEEQWRAKAAPSHPCLIDSEHELAAKYGMSNVPMVVWIDEGGRIVRPSEPAGVSDHFRSMDPDSFETPDSDVASLEDNRARYVEALRDWVRNGADSAFALTPEQVSERTRPASEAELTAGLHARVGHLLYERGDRGGAREHIEAAPALCPEKWTLRRQAMVLDEDTVGTLNVSPGYWSAMAQLGSDPFYAEMDMPGMTGPPQWLGD